MRCSRSWQNLSQSIQGTCAGICSSIRLQRQETALRQIGRLYHQWESLRRAQAYQLVPACLSAAVPHLLYRGQILVSPCVYQVIVQYLVFYEDMLGLQAAGKGVELRQALLEHLRLYKVAVAVHLHDIPRLVQRLKRGPDGRTADVVHVAEHTLGRQRRVSEYSPESIFLLMSS